MWIKKALIATLTLFVLLFASIPAILSIPRMSQLVLSRINERIPGKISASHITLSWFTGIAIKELELQDPQERVVARAHQIVSTKPLLSWFYSPSVLGDITIVKPTVTLIKDAESGSYSIQQVFSLSADESAPPIIFDQLLLDIQEACITFNNSSSQLVGTATISIRDGKLLLNNPLKAQLSLPEKAEIGAHGIIEFLVDDKGFSIPLNPFSLQEMAIHSVTIDPGIVTMQNGGLLSSLIAFLRLNVRSKGQVPMWFTPIYLEIKNGIITCQRTDILVSNAFPIAVWGKIDLIKDNVDMRLGLSAQTLRRAFALIILNSDFLLQIPILGPIRAPRIDTVGATSRIAGLRLQQTPFPPTILFGTLLRASTSLADRNEPPPPAPTTTPFPWS